MAIDVREATVDELSDVLALIEKLHAESPHFSHFTFDQDKTAGLLWQLAEGAHGCVLVASDGVNIVGMLVGMVMEHLISRDKLASDLGFFVDPAHRGGTAGVRLVKAFEAWAWQQDIVELTLEVNTEVEAGRTTRWLEKQGYYLSGYRLVKRG